MSEFGQTPATWDSGEGPAATGPEVGDRALEMLRQTKPWVRFFAVLGFILAIITIAFGIIGGLGGLVTGHPEGLLLLAVYPGLGVLVYLYPSLWLDRYAKRIGVLLEHGRNEHLDSALEAQKCFWKYVGVLTVVLLSVYALLAVVMLIAIAASGPGI